MRRDSGRLKQRESCAEMHERECLGNERDELVATLHELYGRASEVARRVLEDARILEVLHGETSELLYRLRSLPTTSRLNAQAAPPAASPPLESDHGHPRLISFREVAQRVGLSRSSVWRMERTGQFPTRRRLSVNRVAWWESEIDEWLRGRDRP
jgi:predicted DNA-binding transcriptional regulator AlpA